MLGGLDTSNSFPLITWFLDICGRFYDFLMSLSYGLATPINELTDKVYNYINPFTNERVATGLASWIEAMKSHETDANWAEAIEIIIDVNLEILSFFFGVESTLPVGIALLMILIPIIIIGSIVKFILS